MWWKRKKPEAPPAETKPLIVMIDDEPDLCHIVGLALSQDGYNFDQAHDGERGLELIRNRRPMLVILDLKMPIMSGYQMLAKLQQDEELAATPVIVLTSLTEDSDVTDKDWAAKLGVSRFISKPVDATEVVRVVRELLTEAASGNSPTEAE